MYAHNLLHTKWLEILIILEDQLQKAEYGHRIFVN